ncbi:hypothetical protein K443DRAFT_492171 [Laccaria amethystina LaAM-08-1]|uniref:Uncharacterized protein n=1 Tax=Laccaria amethystina LaAM-08-1 TaxID=1095629 RepID=A0A0C9WHJ4_9AGAR|nr:hypothetical protein K443DRAFT_492171 [Laccaria amethystina LaAM-08-1]
MRVYHTSSIELEPCYACMKTTRIEDSGSLQGLAHQRETYAPPPFLSFTPSPPPFFSSTQGDIAYLLEPTIFLPPTHPSPMVLSPADFSTYANPLVPLTRP